MRRRETLVCGEVRRWRGLGWVLILVLILAGMAVLATACGENAAEKAIEKAMEEAAKESGQEVDVDVDVKDGSASVSVSGQDGGMQWQAGVDLELPEGFPAELVPKGGKVAGVYASGADQTVVFQTSDDAKKIYDYYLKTLPDLGYEVTDKLQMEQGGESIIAVSAQKAGSTVTVSGGQKADSGFAYSVQLIQGE